VREGYTINYWHNSIVITGPEKRTLQRCITYFKKIQQLTLSSDFLLSLSY